LGKGEQFNVQRSLGVPCLMSTTGVLVARKLRKVRPGSQKNDKHAKPLISNRSDGNKGHGKGIIKCRMQWRGGHCSVERPMDLIILRLII
jgi:hypothetical protein